MSYLAEDALDNDAGSFRFQSIPPEVDSRHPVDTRNTAM